MRASFVSPAADALVVDVPPYRGKRYLQEVAFAATRVAASTAVVTWTFAPRETPSAVRQLEAGGWRIATRPSKRDPRCRAVPPATAVRPVAETFSTSIAGAAGTFAADFGVFSPGEIDAGSRLLVEHAAWGGPVSEVADIGVGYGALALSLCAAGIAERAIGSDVDAVALSLAETNAAALGCSLETQLSHDAWSIRPTPLTVCNVPTHIPRAESDQFMDTLAPRAGHGRLVLVVHAGLSDRYERVLTDRGVRAERVMGPGHCMFDSGRG
jgi:16S rRNA G1207 methylase RsmC